MKRFIENIIVLAVCIPTLVLMFALLLWSMLINGVAILIGDFKPYKLLDRLNDLFCLMARRVFNG